MISLLSFLIGCLLLIPLVPLIIYGIGLILPSSHTVTRSAVYQTTAEILWAILTSVQDYPAWRTNIERVTVREEDDEINKYEIARCTFVEHSKKDKKTVVMHIVQEPEKKLLRVLDESVDKRKSTFTGSWTFSIEPVDGNQVRLKITEQGVINKPMVRVAHKLLFGYHRRIDRFLKDLGKEIDLGLLKPEEAEEEEEEEAVVEEDEYEARPDESMMLDKSVLDRQESKLDKEWDFMSEIYERKKA
ncbi:hypothetical protein BDB01DRAFT_361404 [Pilobolus umbonatus]|nr:hypothetical protein BDB01DRAFT_361404 [Pilobolus umbonatus]